MLKKIMRTISPFLLSGILFLQCGCSEEEQTGMGFLFTTSLSSNPACLDPQYSDNDQADMVIANIMEGLLRLDENGVPTEAGAESYTISEGGLYYMFNLREESYWYQVGMEDDDWIPVTADDYVFAFRRMLDPVTDSPYAELFSCIQNAVAVRAGTMPPESLGVSAPDDHTVIFRLDYTNAEFLHLLAQPYAAPCNAAFFYSTNGRYGLDAKTILCNGPFCLTKWNYDAYGSDNFMNFRKNPSYYDMESVAPSSLTFHIQRSEAAADKDFTDGNSDVLVTRTNASRYMESKDHTVVTEYAETLGLIFHPDNEILKNKDFRLALIHGINRAAYTPKLSADLKPAYGIIPPAVDLMGTSYREMYADEPLAPTYDPELSARLFAEAAKELHLNSTNTIRILVSNNITDTDALLTICQEWQTLFGQYIGLETVTEEEYRKRIAEGDYSMALYSIHPERNSCYETLRLFSEEDDRLGFQSMVYSSAMAKLATTEQLTDAVELYGMAEQAILDTNTFVPLFYKNSYLVHSSANTDLGYDAFSGIVDFRNAKHFTD